MSRRGWPDQSQQYLIRSGRLPMPFIQSPAKVLLTGANGYFAVHAIKDLLDRGYTVVGTVRSDSKGEELIKLFPLHADKLTYAVVPDILKRGAFDQVIREGNYDAIAHAASPVVLPSGTIEDFVRPAVDGTVGILESVKSYGQTVKRVLIVSSTVTVDTFQKGVKHNETHWNEFVTKLVEQQGNNAPFLVLYSYSKILAEKAVWKWWSENEKHVDWDLVTINPCFLLGEPIHAVTSRDQLSSTNAVLSAITTSQEDPTQKPWPIVHVRDVAAIHSAILERKEHLGKRRVITVGSEPSWQDMLDDTLADFSGVPKGNPGVGTTSDTGSPSWDTSFARELLGRDFIGTKGSLVETEAYYRKKGWSFFV
ncbi:NAD-P-binding protein [Rhizoctonia solani]|uniref:NAD-P-binding protein n=1 Tax=Rhizoctonia solani TaxID=456999 RepID=A0A8H7M5B7_9AGAM|nr:NAD-P-binding protein [Rhizoctonia solani]